MKNQKARKLGRNGAFSKSINSTIIAERGQSVEQLARKSSYYSLKLFNQANSTLFKSFIAIGELDEALSMLLAIGLDHDLALFIVALAWEVSR